MSRKTLYIIGARGAGREFFARFSRIPGFSDQYEFGGYLDDKSTALDGYMGYPPIVGSVEDYRPEENDVFACALGDPVYRRKYIDIVLSKGGRFETFIAPSASIYNNARIGQGTVIYENSTVSCDVTVDDYVLMLSNAVLGHDVHVGRYSVIEANASACGFASIGEGVILHTSSVVLPKVKVGDSSIVGAGSVVISNVKAGVTVFGVPAVKIF